MNYRIVSDSSINKHHFEGMNFISCPLKIRTPSGEYVDDDSLDLVKMVEDMSTTKGKTSTSCPNVHEYLEAFRGYDDIFVITISGNLSGSANAAEKAKEEYLRENPDAHVMVIDSLSTGGEMELIAERIYELVQEGYDFFQIQDAVNEYRKHTHLIFSLESMQNLVNNGRVSKILASICGILNIRFVGIASDDGHLQLANKARGEKKTIIAIYEEMLKRNYKGSKVRISHCFNENAASQLKDMILEGFPGADVTVIPMSGLCSYYAEKGGMIIGYDDL